MRQLAGWLTPAAALAFCAINPSLAAASRAGGETHRLLVLGPNEHTFVRVDPYLPDENHPPRPTRQRTARRALAHAATTKTKRATVATVLSRLRSSGAIDHATYTRYRSEYRLAERTLKKLSGTRRVELAAVMANMQAIAAAGELSSSRLPALFTTLARNRQWWTTGPLLSYGRRVSFSGSRLVWEYYPGQGIQIQWLGTFGTANGYYLSTHQDSAFRQILSEVLPLASQRGDGIAWEYMFRFDGGQPPWTSGLSQGTALQAFARAWSRFRETSYLSTAQSALRLFTEPPPTGVRIKTSAGASYLQYTYAPSERIINGFIQAVIGLYDYTKLTGDPLGETLFEEGDAEARAALPHYDTGAWSMYDQHSESDLSYHDLLTEFLKNLCQRTRHGQPLAPTAPAPTTETSTPVASSGGSSAQPSAMPSAAKTTADATTQIPGDEIYCLTAERFTSYVHEPPAIELLTHRLLTSSRGGVAISLSKTSTLSLSVSRSGHVVWTNHARVAAGRPRLLWVTPHRQGEYTVTVSATDIAGNRAQTQGSITLTRRR